MKFTMIEGEGLYVRDKEFYKGVSWWQKAAKNITLTVEDGDIYGFIGHNGAGKITTIKAIVGVLDFDDGEILINGHSVKKEPLACKKVTAYIPDSPDLYDYLTGIQYLNFVADIFGIDQKTREERIRELSEDVNDVKEATNLEAMSFLFAGEPMKAIDLLDQQIRPMFQDTELLAQTYSMLGEINKSKETCQIAMYQHLILFLSDMSYFLLLYQEDEGRVREIIHRTLATIDTFHIDYLHPNTAAVFYQTAAIVCMKYQDEDMAMGFRSLIWAHRHQDRKA